ncbi:MAG: phenylalanine--tRNA ligase subunit beta [Rhodothermaceae bacterium]|nr:phenylalanine--tRNA ligase subunit beta [Rhodothermaceae bacterium]
MNISFNWLRDYVETDLSAEALGDLLTMSGLELEGIETLGPDLDGIVVGHVLDTRKHPNADRLTLCTVDLGGEEPVQIVCGAPNVAAGQKVPVATNGTTLMLPSRDEPGERVAVKIKRSKIRGEESNGMICAEDELGLGDDHDGILVLKEHAPVGQPFATYLADEGLATNDAVLDLAITPNRPDATSHIGVARDVAALTNRSLIRPEVAIPEVGGAATEQASVTIDVPDECPRFVGMIVRGVTVGESPAWLKERLNAIGLRPISNVVDVTNFVMMETGQPLHAYDLDKLADAALYVRKSQQGERFTTLDGKQRALPEGTVMVADGDGYIGIAGVMGGAESEVSDTTTNVFIEGAYWDPVTIRRAAKALGMQTDASYRFERGVDPTGQPYAVARAAHLVADLGGGTLVPGRIDAHPKPHEPITLTIRPSRVATILGTEVPDEDIARLLRAIGFTAERAESRTMDAFAEEVMRAERLVPAAEEAVEAGLAVTVPPFRPDIEREIDVIEEIARLWGYDQIPDPATTPIPLIPAGDTPEAAVLDQLRARLVGLGFRELYTNSLVPTATAEQFTVAELTDQALQGVETLNPISQDMAAMRPSLLPGLLGAMAYNQARGAEALRVVELGHVYGRAHDPQAPVEGYHEHTSLILGLSGPAQRQGWDTDARDADIFDLKGALMHVLDALGLPEIVEVPPTEPGALTAYRLVLEVQGQHLGILARVSDALMDQYDLQAPVYFAELDADLLASLARREGPTRYSPISRFPAVERDLAVVVADAQPVGPMLATIRQTAGPLLQDVRVFDLYRGDRIEGGHKSVAFALRFAADRTLRDEEVDGRIRKVMKVLEREHNARLRS